MTTSTHCFSLDGGHPSLDLANTLDDRMAASPDDLLADFPALLDFANAAGLIDLDLQRKLGRRAEQRSYEADAVLATVRALRESVYRVGVALVAAQTPDPADLHVIAEQASAAHASGTFAQNDDGFHWSWEDADDLRRPLWQLADAAIDLFSRHDLSRLRICAADDCGWIFLDETKNRSRKWCDMATCGNRAKAARYRKREQVAGTRG
jgi:predicted RNA-binding Zn ribbon-like protein